MRGNLFVPDEVKSEIFEHVEKSTKEALDGYYSACEDEDTLTGHLFGRLRSGKRNVNVTGIESPNNWQWSIDYRKFGGGRAHATEKTLGADGIIELHLKGSRTLTKSLLFQSKKDLRKEQRLLSQCARLSTWKEAACVINYTEDGFFVFDIEDILRSRGQLPEIDRRTSLANYINDKFLACEVGDTSLRYFPKERVLQWRSINSQTVAANFAIKNRLRINISTVDGAHFDERLVDKVLAPEEIYRHRMEATNDEILQVPNVKRASLVDIEKARKALYMTYHPDRYSVLSDLDREILTQRINEMTNAYHEERWRAEGREKNYR